MLIWGFAALYPNLFRTQQISTQHSAKDKTTRKPRA